MKKFDVIKNSFGYYEIFPKPTNEELKDYYNQKYYQNQSGNYRNDLYIRRTNLF